ncbi:sugar phosphate isomerase/epimerase family protein [Wocania ichthyoenteri]|uniref:sugar phosphate isomerase/epimerase family protein n=1 Tax=Wocania ichthyoenteri TaxID=1230531 RepID=UPI00053DF527|nr:sugar phosphate isomerase/epimerase family protein [Wocania ichthyoenteri]
MKAEILSKKNSSLLFLLLLVLFFACAKNQKKVILPEVDNKVSGQFFKISLAEWSLHKTFNDDGVSPFEFAERAKSMGFEALEYVSQLYSKQIDELGFDTVIDSLKKESETYGLKNNLIMVDQEGDLAVPDSVLRNQAVENHKKWVHAAKALGCQAIRVNLPGSSDSEIWKVAAFDGLSKLASYADEQNINVIVENHGGFSSNVAMLVDVIQKVNASNCGVLPDFGNFCIKRVDSECVDEYDMYKGVEEMMPLAKGVSAKSYDFDENGNETKIDFYKMLQLVKNAGYSDFIGVEYEGSRLSEVEGILATKKLLLKASNKLK